MIRFSGGGRGWRRVLVQGVSTVSLAAAAAHAQYAPVEGAHYAAMAGTGHQGVSNTQGSYGASVPLDLPVARGALPIPLQVVYGAHSMGAAGLGWDVPLSFVARTGTTARQRPAPQAFSLDQPAPLKAPERWSLTLLGERIDLIRNAANTAWVGRRGNAQIELRSAGDGLLVAYDGEGRTYNFSSKGATAGSRLAGGHMFLLTSIVDAVGNTVQLNYGISTPALPGGDTGLAINLTSVNYNPHATTAGCFKHRVLLNYDAAVVAPAPPLSMTLFSGSVLTRVQKLVSITVKSRPTCTGQELTLTNYTFSYQVDADTRLPQLKSVTRTGQQATGEQGMTLPVATYSYGSVVDKASNSITYQQVQSTGPAASPGAHTYDWGLAYTESPNTRQMLLDLNGDGRDDFLNATFRNPPKPIITLNTTGAGGPMQFSKPGGPPVSLSESASVPEVKNLSGTAYTNVQFIDMNGDGRLDKLLLSSFYQDDWEIRLNTPDPADPQNIVWKPIRLSVKRVKDALHAAGYQLARDSSYAPPFGLSTTAPEVHLYCWKANANLYWIGIANLAECPGVSPNYSVDARMQTITQFELKDVNGDGYPDFVYNASPVTSDSQVNAAKEPTFAATTVGETTTTTVSQDISGSRDVMVMINTAGAHIEDGTELFASPVVLEAGGANGCGIARWRSDPEDTAGGRLNQVCGFVDVNGDGISDRVTHNFSSATTTAKLGTGDITRPFAAASLTLPGVLSRVETELVPDTTRPYRLRPKACAANAGDETLFTTSVTRALRDINGDGIPDYLYAPEAISPAAWKVSLGTGTGFAPEVTLTAGNLALRGWLSLENNTCTTSQGFFNGVKGTQSGLYELDGDGQPEIVSVNKQSNRWDIWQIKPPVAQVDVGGGIASAPAAGRLVRIDHGYGASTTIGYRSAKEEWNPQHSVPFPEIVVESVGVKDAGNASLLVTTRYAYRGAELIFDPAYDVFRFAGYRRSVALHSVNGSGTATITDTLPLQPFAAGMDDAARFGRYAKAGLVSDVVTLAGNVGNNPWDLLNVDIGTDARRIAGTHQDWGVRLLPEGSVPADSERCVDMVHPYDFALSKSVDLSVTNNACAKRGFVYGKETFSWRGNPGVGDAALSANTVQTNSEIVAIDDYGRTTGTRQDNDLTDAGDDLCTQTTYAAPSGMAARVLNAPASQSVTNCGSKTLSSQKFEYDTTAAGVKLPAGSVTKGLLTSRVISVLDQETGAAADPALPEIRAFDAVYDSTGNLASVKMVRDDGATVSVSTTYDTFSLVPTNVQTEGKKADGTALPLQSTNAVIDAVTLDVLSVTDANGTVRGATYDGFGRPVLETVAPASGSAGVLSKTSYLGFALGQSGGRRIVRKNFSDPVPAATADTAAGRTATVYLDTLARTARTEVALGVDYAGKTLIVGQRTYDVFGRVQFEADPFQSDTSFTTAYGSTYHYYPDGTPQCRYRAAGSRPFNADLTSAATRSDEASERYVSCLRREFIANQEVIEFSDAASRLPSSPQAGVVQRATYSAIGRLKARETLLPNTNEPRAELIEFTYSPLGNLSTLTRFQNPQEFGGAITTTMRHDSMGRLLRLEEPASAPQYSRYDSWGALISTQWCDTTAGSCASGSYNRGTFASYDALGRLVHMEDRANNVVVAASLRDYSYDVGVGSAIPALVAKNVLGRLASATSPTSSVSYSYDAFGRTEAAIHIDRTEASSQVYVQKNDYHGDGSLRRLGMLLPDAAFADEGADYAYDSAGRLRSIKYSDGTLAKDLFVANGAADLDVLGRIRRAQFGANTLTADYAETGRRLLGSLKIESPSPMATTREILFAGTNGTLPAFDPLGRERTRKEVRNGEPNAAVRESGYDELGRLVSSRLRLSNGGQTAVWGMGYDALGNLLGKGGDTLQAQVDIGYQGVDRDRICYIAYGAPPSPACNVSYDGVGNITQMPTRSSGLRTLTYFPSGRTRSITSGATTAMYDYDAFGTVQRLVLSSPSSTDTRRDKHFGSQIYLRDEVVNGVRSAVINRSFPAPQGARATRHGAAANAAWTFTFGELRGTRFVTDQTGAFVQDIDYEPYGEIRARSGATPGMPTYVNAQWNGGDSLAALGVTQLGARIYDPEIGRFLSRDPLLIPRSGASTNPYAFAMNDPVNRADPSGLDSVGGVSDCYFCAPPPLPGGPWLPSPGGDTDVHDVPTRAPPKAPCKFVGCPREPDSVPNPTPTDSGTPASPPPAVPAAPQKVVWGPNLTHADGSVGPAMGPQFVVPDDPCISGQVSCADSAVLLRQAANNALAEIGNYKPRKIPVQFSRLSSPNSHERGRELIGELTGWPGDALDVGEELAKRLELKNLNGLGPWGQLSDLLGVIAAADKFVEEPTQENGIAVIRNVVDNVLMSLGPSGMSVKYGMQIEDSLDDKLTPEEKGRMYDAKMNAVFGGYGIGW